MEINGLQGGLFKLVIISYVGWNISSLHYEGWVVFAKDVDCEEPVPTR